MLDQITRAVTRHFLILLLFIGAALASIGCGLIDDDSDEPSATPGGNGGASTSSIRIMQAVMGTDITPEQQITRYATRAFPEGTSRVYAVLVMEGVQPGAEVTGRWFQLSTENAPPDGLFVNEAGVTLTEENVNASGQARVALDFGSTTGTLPNGDWLVRVYVDGEFVRTMGFVISSFASFPEGPVPTPSGGTGPTGATGAEPTPPAQPEPTATQEPAPQSYTVVPGDTLTVIAEEFKGPAEPTDAYIQRLLELNDLQPGAILFVGQELLIPPPQ